MLTSLRLRALFATTAMMLGVQIANGETPSSSPIGDAYGDAFVNYEPLVIPATPASSPVLAPAAPKRKPPKAVSKDDGREVVDVAFLRKEFPRLEARAIDNPTDANVSDYLYVKRVILDKAQRFSEAVTRVLHQDPLLDENNRVPYASLGAQTVRNANYQAQHKAVDELSLIGGLVVFVDGSCRFCAMQLPILDMLHRESKMDFVVLTLDGTRPKGYTGPILRDNGLYHKLGLKLTPSVVYVAHPQAYKGDGDPNNYLVVAQGFYAEDELIKQIAYAGHGTKLLSADVMRDLDVWDRGVASTDDLRALKLDPNKPGSFKSILQPYLLKQY